jgi:hypothetical protein
MSNYGLYYQPVSYPKDFITLPFVPPSAPYYDVQNFKCERRTLTASGGVPVMTAGQTLQKTVFEFLDINLTLSNILITLHLDDAVNYDNVAPFGMVCWDYGTTVNRISITTYNFGVANITNWAIDVIAFPLSQPTIWPYGDSVPQNTRQSAIFGTPLLPNPPLVKFDYLAPVGQSFNENPITVGETGLLYFAEDNGALICLTDNGATATPLWTQQTGYTNLVSPTLGRDNTMFAVGTNELRAIENINTATPSTLWTANLTPLTFPLPPLVFYNALSGEATIYVSGSNGYIYAVSGDGVVLWSKLLVATFAKLALNATGTVLYATVGNTLYAISTTGVVLWSRVVGNGMPPPSVGANGIIYVFSGSTVYAVQDNGTTSTLKWVLVLGLIPQRSISIGSNGRLYLVSNNQITAVVDNGASGTIKWLYAINPALAPNALTPITIGLDGTLYTTGDYALAVCVTDNDTTFVVNWAFQVLAGGFSSPCSIGLNKRIYFGGDHGHIIAL